MLSHVCSSDGSILLCSSGHDVPRTVVYVHDLVSPLQYRENQVGSLDTFEVGSSINFNEIFWCGFRVRVVDSQVL